MSKFSEKYKQYFEDSNEERPLAEDCQRCKLRSECQQRNMMTIDPKCLINGASLHYIKISC